MHSSNASYDPPTPPTRRQARPGPYAEQGDVIRRRRKELKLSQTALGDLYGSQQGYISDVERGYVNFSGSDLDWFRRMSAALRWSVEYLMQALGIDYVKANEAQVKTPSSLALIQSAVADYAAVEIIVYTDKLTGGNVLQKIIVVPTEVAELDGLSGYQVSDNTLDVAAPGQIAVYASATPRTDDVVVIRLGERLALAYYSEAGIVATDRPLTPRTPLEFEPDAILGVVQTFVSADRPRRVTIN